MQLNLFAAVSQTYLGSSDILSQEELYANVAKKMGFKDTVLNEKEPVGKSKTPVSIMKRKIRWFQQTLKQAGVIENVGRGQWRLAKDADDASLHVVGKNEMLLGFNTRLGAAVIASCEDFFNATEIEIDLVFTSPPYPLATARKYGNPTEQEYVDWICKTLESTVERLVDGGSICINVGNDIFMKLSPARSMYQERLVLALHDRLGLHKMDTFIWVANKAPGPIAWASKQRTQLNAGYEPVYWFTNNPLKVKSNNQRVLHAHSDKHHSFVTAGGEKEARSHSDGAHVKVKGAYSTETKGRIARNVQSFAMCRDDKNKEYREFCQQHELIPHGASMPVRLAEFFIEFLTEENDLVVDPFGGRLKTAMAAESLNRRWLTTERIPEYVLGAAGGFNLAHVENHPLLQGLGA